MKTATTRHIDVLLSLNRALGFKVSLCAFFLAIGATLATTTLNLNVIELNLFEKIQHNLLDEIAIIWLLAAGAVALELRYKHKRQSQIDADRVHVLQTTMRTVHDIVGNRLNDLQLLRLEAEGLVQPETLVIFDESIRATMDQLRTLAELTTFTERPMACGPGLDLRDQLAAA